MLVADDIDRLDADELLALLKVVRLLGRFPNVHYLIAYDHATVEKLLETRALGRRSSVFMEKIVQYPFEVPPIAPVIQRRLLSEAIVKFITLHNIRLKDSQAERFSEFIGVLAPAFVTPRAQNRFGEQLLSFGGMLDFEEIDVVDFVALSFLRVFYHGIYDRIQAWKSALQSGKELVGYTSSDISDGEWIRRIRDAVDLDDDVIVVKRVLAGLFPGIRSDMLYARAHPRSLSDDDYFHRYFLFGIPENDIQDQLIKSAITNIVVDNATDPGVLRYSEILDGENDQLAALGYEKGQKLRADVWVGASLSLVVFLFDRIKALPEEVPSFDSGERVLWRWVATETLESLISGELTAESIFASGLSEYHVLMLVGRMMAAESRHSDDRMARALEGFSGIYRDRLMNDLDSVLDSNLDFNSIVSVISRLSTDKNFHELGDTLISSGEPDQLDRVAQAMVTVNRWRGSDGTSDELVFNSDTLERVFKPEAVIELAGRLPVAPPVLSIEKLDTSSENRAFLARAAVKSIAGTPS
ncbi:hypothetical protein AWC27_19710 [Mycobacterium szulgai]|uniref:KAP NTPase domain-containing protein n=1 Tax=Mycobacterium szulgai TaxID=1787 RepID=A0A1X2F6Y4_MYCSZ|nr:hypothetical protein AWC27_19710 [Mycobacterium szulgai]